MPSLTGVPAKEFYLPPQPFISFFSFIFHFFFSVFCCSDFLFPSLFLFFSKFLLFFFCFWFFLYFDYFLVVISSSVVTFHYFSFHVNIYSLLSAELSFPALPLTIFFSSHFLLFGPQLPALGSNLLQSILGSFFLSFLQTFSCTLLPFLPLTHKQEPFYHFHGCLASSFLLAPVDLNSLDRYFDSLLSLRKHMMINKGNTYRKEKKSKKEK